MYNIRNTFYAVYCLLKFITAVYVTIDLISSNLLNSLNYNPVIPAGEIGVSVNRDSTRTGIMMTIIIL